MLVHVLSKVLPKAFLSLAGMAVMREIPAAHGFGTAWVYRLTCIFLVCINNYESSGRNGVAADRVNCVS